MPTHIVVRKEKGKRNIEIAPETHHLRYNTYSLTTLTAYAPDP